MRRVRVDEGYTMLELMIVIAIIGLVAVISIPNIIVLMSRTRMNGAVTRLERTIDVTRKTSMTNRVRSCVTFGSEAGYADSNSENYLIDVHIFQETAVNSGVWVEVLTPTELGSWTNDPTTELYNGITLEGDPTTTTVFGTTAGCTGLVFNNNGYLENPTVEFAYPCGGANCAVLTVRNKIQRFVEQRTLWIDRGGNVRITVGPLNPPILDPASASPS
jgi:prepilin-type N-terminal cleavage/methylation domain-containing protein